MSDYYVLDACALIAFLNDEAGADVVEELLRKSNHQEPNLFLHRLNLLEVYYGIYREVGPEISEQTLEKIRALPVTEVTEITQEVFLEAGRLKATVSDIRGMPVSEAKIAFQNSRVQSKGIFSGCFVDKDFILSRLFSHETHILPSRRVILCQCKQLQRDEIENRILVDNLLTYSDVARVFDLNPSCLVCRKRIIKILKRVIEAEQVIRYGVSDYEG